MAKSVEEKAEEHYKELLRKYGIRYFAKNESINPEIDNSLKEAKSKTGGDGINYPDIKLFLDDGSRRIPVMIEAKGSKGKLEKLDSEGNIIQVTFYNSNSKKGTKHPHKKGDPNYNTIKTYAVNGALHYGNAILDFAESYDEVIIIGVNGTKLDKNGNVMDPECKAYYVSKSNNKVPKEIKKINSDESWALFKEENLGLLYKILDTLKLTDKERADATTRTEDILEKRIKSIHQSIYDNDAIMLDTNKKLYLFVGLIMAGLHTKGVKQLQVADLAGNQRPESNDGITIIEHIKAYLGAKRKKRIDEIKEHQTYEQVEKFNENEETKDKMVLRLVSPIFKDDNLWMAHNGESVLKTLYRQIYDQIIPLLESNLHLDFTGKILNSLNDWVDIKNDKANDVVLTPSYVTNLMTKLTKTNMNSLVWDLAMGSGGFLVAAMDAMIKDANHKLYYDKKKLKQKIENIKTNQLLGVEVLGNIYVLAILNMILMGDGSTNMIRGNSHEIYKDLNFPANVFLLNPPYSASGKGFNFVEEALSQMNDGYAAILIQENAGAGKGEPYTKQILKHNTLLASIHMPIDLFRGKSSVQTAIYVFQVGQPHDPNQNVKFIDFSKDGYTRLGRKKSSQKVNLKDTADAKGRYKELVSIVLDQSCKTHYYTQENGKYIKDTIGLNGDDWTFRQHQKINIKPTQKDFIQTVSSYLSWQIGRAINGDNND